MAIAAGTVALWNLENSLADSSGNGYTLTNTGNTQFVSTPTAYQGTYSAGPYSGGNYLSSSAARTAMAGTTTWTVEFLFYPTNLSAQKMGVTCSTSPGADEFLINILPSGAIRFVFDETDVFDSAAGVIGLNQWNYIAAVCSGTSAKVYACAAGGTPALVINQTSSRTSFPTAGEITFGCMSWLPSFLPASGCYIDGVRVSNIAQSTLPTVDTVDGSTWGSLKRRRRG